MEAKANKGQSLYCILSTEVFKLKQEICPLCNQKHIWQQGLRDSEKHPLLYMFIIRNIITKMENNLPQMGNNLNNLKSDLSNINLFHFSDPPFMEK